MKDKKSQLLTDELEKTPEYFKNLLEKISFTHFVELLKIDDPNKRRFYEWLIIGSTLSVSELKQKINTQTYERTGLSKSHENAIQKLQSEIKPQTTVEAVKSIYLFDFLETSS